MNYYLIDIKEFYCIFFFTVNIKLSNKKKNKHKITKKKK